MSGDESAFAALGLRPGAGRAEVNEAYRRLIKIHHPDRNGGDGRRAAQINRAYTQLSRDRDLAPRQPRYPPVSVRPAGRRSRRYGGIWLLGIAAAGLAAAGFAGVETNDVGRVMSAPFPDAGVRVQMPSSPAADFDQPLETSIINQAIADAAGLYGAGDWQAAIQYSRDCSEKVRMQPKLPMFDSCVAFDEAMLILDADSSGQAAGFSGSAIDTRHGALARAFGSDFSSADSRLQRIRSHVELTLLPVLDPAAGQPAA